MAHIKLSTGFYLRSGKHAGSCVQFYAQGTSIKNKNNPRYFRTALQDEYRLFLMIAVRAWRDMLPATRSNWISWASSFPQECRHNSDKNLSGYQLFIKRHYYLFLSSPDPLVFMTDPIPALYAFDTLSASCLISADSLILRCSFLLKTSKFFFALSLSSPQSLGSIYPSSRYRYIVSIPNSDQDIDITDIYISIFGKLPKLLDLLFFSFIAAGIDQGQFSKRVQSSLLVQPSIPHFPVINFGRLYNRYASFHSYFAPPGWHLPSDAEFLILINNFGGPSIAGKHLKSSDPRLWFSSVANDNTSIFNGVGSGLRSNSDGSFQQFKLYSYLHSSASFGSPSYLVLQQSTDAALQYFISTSNFGISVRFLKDDSVDPGFLLDFEGNVYPTIKAGDQVWLSSNWKSQYLFDGTLIPNITDNTLWISATDLAQCAFDNNESNV